MARDTLMCHCWLKYSGNVSVCLPVIWKFGISFMSDCPEPLFGRWRVSWGEEVSTFSISRVMPIGAILRLMSERLKMKSLSSPLLSAVYHMTSVLMVLTCWILSLSSYNECWFLKKSTFDGFQGCRLLRFIWGHVSSSFWVGMCVLKFTVVLYRWRGMENIRSLIWDSEGG